MHTPHLRPMAFGEILDSAFSLYRRNFVPFFITALLPLIPTALISGMYARTLTTAQATGGTVPGGFSGLPIAALAVVITLSMWAALTREVGQAWTGGEVSVGDGYRAGFSRFLPLLGAIVVAYLLMVVGFVVVGIVTAILAAGVGAGGSLVSLVMIPVIIAIFVGMICAGSALFGVLPAVVLEKLGPWDAITRSVRLARGALGRVVGIVFVTGLIVTLPVIGVLAVTGGFAVFTNPGTVPSTGQFWLQQVANSVTGALTTPFLVASLVILYFDRRVRTEALDVQLAADALASG